MLVVLGTIAIVLAVIAIGVAIDKKVGFLPGPKDLESPRKQIASHAAGEAPSTALHIRDAQIAILRTSQRCPECRAAMDGEPDDSVRYDGHDLLVLHFRCTQCSASRALYVVIR